MEMKRKHSLASRVLAVCMVIMMVFSLMPAGFGQTAYADSGSEEKLYEVTINVAPKEADVTFYQGNEAVTPVEDGQVTDKGVVGEFHQYILNVPEGRYSYRGVEGSTELGGMTFDVPFEDEVMYDPETGGGKPSGKGLVLTFRRVNYYTNDYKIKNIGDYTIHAIPAGMPEVVFGPQYIDDRDDQGRVVTPGMVIARGNALVYTVNYDINDEYLKSHYSVPQQPNDTFEESSSTLTSVFTLKSTVEHTITAPKGAKAQVFKQVNNFNVVGIEETSQSENEDGTITHKFITPGGSNLTYRVSMDGKVTRAGFFGPDPEHVTVTFDETEDPKSTANVGDQAAIKQRIESSTMVNVNGQNSLNLGVDETFRLRGYRAAWQIINTDTANIMIEPDFNYEIISGGEHIQMTPVTGMCTGNAGEGEKSNWWDIKGISEGTAVVEISYDAIKIGGKGTTFHGLYGATNPQRKSLVVINVGGQENTLKMYPDGSDVTWDTEYDTVYFVEDTGSMTFTATLGEDAPDKVELSTDKGATWKTVTSVDGKYIAEGLVPGNNILKFTKGNKVEYQVVRGAKITYTITNKTHDFEGVYAVGDVLEIKFQGIFNPIPKISGIYNPGYGDSHWITYKNADGVKQSSFGRQYAFINDHKLTLTLEKAGEIELSNGALGSRVLGHSYLIGDHRTLTDTGCGVNFSAGASDHEKSILPTIKLTVNEKAAIPVTINTNADDVTAYFTNSAGETFTFEGNTAAMVFGNYDYAIVAPGYIRAEGKLSISPADKNISINVILEKGSDTTWDGLTVEEAPIVDDVYQISKASQLVWFAQQVNVGTGSNWDAKLLNDISLGNKNPWTPMEDYAGTFDGNGHFIDGLYIVSDASNQALFGKTVDGATIQNLGVSGTVTVTGKNSINTAGIVAEAVTGTTIKNCTNRVNVSGIKHVGGVIGRIWEKATVTNCYNTGTVEGEHYAGGVIGQISIAGEKKLISIKNCYNTGNIICPYSNSSTGGVTYGEHAYLVKNSYTLDTSCAHSTAAAGTQVTSDELKTLAPTLGSAYLAGGDDYNNGYPILAWERDRVLTYIAEDAVADIENYKNPADYRTAQQTKLTAAIEAGKAAIASAKSVDELNKAVADAKAAMDKIKTDAQLKAEEEANKPSDTNKPVNPPADTPTTPDDDKPVDTPVNPPADTPATPDDDKPADTDQPADTPTTPDADKPADTPITPDANKPADQPNDDPADKAPVVKKQQLKAPAKVKASNVAYTGKIKLTWNKVKNAKEYKVYRSTSKNGKYTLMKTVKKTSYVNTSAKAGKTYFYKVKAVPKSKNVLTSKYSAVVKRTADLKAPVVTAKNKSKKQVKLTWKKVSGAKKYTVYRATSKNGKYKAIKTTTKLSFTNKNLKKGKTYYYKVKAIAKNSAANSAFSTVDKCKVKK